MKKNRLLAKILLFTALLGMLPLQVSAVTPPELTSTHVLLMDAEYKEVLYEKSGYDRAYPASTTKIMTALLVLEAIDEGSLSAQTSVTASGNLTQGLSGNYSTAHIKEGEVLTVEQLLYCLMLPSANEAANILAETVDGDIKSFVEHMNRRARELGCEGTHFVNPHGMHDENHYSTAYDLALMMKAAMEYDLLRKICTSPNYDLPATNVAEPRTIRNTNALTSNWTYTGYLYGPGAGGKTGSTPEAGKCLVESAKKDDTYLISVVLGGEEQVRGDGSVYRPQFTETIELMNWGFSNFRRTTLAEDSEPVEAVKVTLSRETDQVLVKPQGTITRTLPREIQMDKMEKRINLFHESVEAPVEAGQVLGTMVLMYEGEEYGTLDLVAVDDVERSELLYKKTQVLKFFQNTGVRLAVVVILIAVGIVLLRIFVFQKHRRYRSSTGARRSRYSGRR